MTNALVDAYLSSKDAVAFTSGLEDLCQKKIFEAKDCLSYLISKLKSITNEELVILGSKFYDNILNQASLENESFTIVDQLWQIYSTRRDFNSAVTFFLRINLDSENMYRVSELTFSKQTKEKIFKSLLNIITAQFELKEFISAEQLLRKCHERRRKIKDPLLLVQYNYCCGQFFDFNRKFLMGSFRYFQACNIPESPIKEDNLLEILTKAVNTCILSEAGSKKAYLMNNLVKDDRAKKLENYPILEKMSKELFISKKEIAQFKKCLLKHQEIKLENGLTNVETAFLEHNIIVTSNYFRDIRLASLAKKVNLSESELEKILQNMKSEDKIQLSIDHRNKLILFKSDDQIISQARQSLVNFCTIMEKL